MSDQSGNQSHSGFTDSSSVRPDIAYYNPNVTDYSSSAQPDIYRQEASHYEYYNNEGQPVTYHPYQGQWANTGASNGSEQGTYPASSETAAYWTDGGYYPEIDFNGYGYQNAHHQGAPYDNQVETSTSYAGHQQQTWANQPDLFQNQPNSATGNAQIPQDLQPTTLHQPDMLTGSFNSSGNRSDFNCHDLDLVESSAHPPDMVPYISGSDQLDDPEVNEITNQESGSSSSGPDILSTGLRVEERVRPDILAPATDDESSSNVTATEAEVRSRSSSLVVHSPTGAFEPVLPTSRSSSITEADAQTREKGTRTKSPSVAPLWETSSLNLAPVYLHPSQPQTSGNMPENSGNVQLFSIAKGQAANFSASSLPSAAPVARPAAQVLPSGKTPAQSDGSLAAQFSSLSLGNPLPPVSLGSIQLPPMPTSGSTASHAVIRGQKSQEPQASQKSSSEAYSGHSQNILTAASNPQDEKVLSTPVEQIPSSAHETLQQNQPVQGSLSNAARTEPDIRQDVFPQPMAQQSISAHQSGNLQQFSVPQQYTNPQQPQPAVSLQQAQQNLTTQGNMLQTQQTQQNITAQPQMPQLQQGGLTQQTQSNINPQQQMQSQINFNTQEHLLLAQQGRNTQQVQQSTSTQQVQQQMNMQNQVPQLTQGQSVNYSQSNLMPQNSMMGGFPTQMMYSSMNPGMTGMMNYQGNSFQQPMMGMQGNPFQQQMMGMPGNSFQQQMMGMPGNSIQQQMMGMPGNYHQPQANMYQMVMNNPLYQQQMMGQQNTMFGQINPQLQQRLTMMQGFKPLTQLQMAGQNTMRPMATPTPSPIPTTKFSTAQKPANNIRSQGPLKSQAAQGYSYVQPERKSDGYRRSDDNSSLYGSYRDDNSQYDFDQYNRPREMRSYSSRPSSRPSSRAGSIAPSVFQNELNAYANQTVGFSPRPPSRTSSRLSAPFPDLEGVSNASEEAQLPEISRMTPAKFPIPHMTVKMLSSGYTLETQANVPVEGQPAVVNIVKRLNYTQSLIKFPGPLIKGQTHKKDVLDYCSKMAAAARNDTALLDKSSTELLWLFLHKFVKQNGTYVASDIAELLLDCFEVNDSSYAISNKTNAHSGMSQNEKVNRYRQLVLFGSTKEALEWAMNAELWGHALFLSNKLGPRVFAQVLTRFANTSMLANDPLQTLYQLMSNRMPSSATNLDDRWGSWRAHLAMMLCNPSDDKDLNMRSIVTLGDSLATKGLLHASQFCYLMASLDLEPFNRKTAKLSMLGISSGGSLEEFTNESSLRMTEIFEYGKSLANDDTCIAHLQLCKFYHVRRLVDEGFPVEALSYCEAIARRINKNPHLFSAYFIMLLHETSEKLKYFDVESLHLKDGQELCLEWLKNLEQVLLAKQSGSSTVAVSSFTNSSAPSVEYSHTTGVPDVKSVPQTDPEDKVKVRNISSQSQGHPSQISNDVKTGLDSQQLRNNPEAPKHNYQYYDQSMGHPNSQPQMDATDGWNNATGSSDFNHQSSNWNQPEAVLYSYQPQAGEFPNSQANQFSKGQFSENFNSKPLNTAGQEYLNYGNQQVQQQQAQQQQFQQQQGQQQQFQQQTQAHQQQFQQQQQWFPGQTDGQSNSAAGQTEQDDYYSYSSGGNIPAPDDVTNSSINAGVGNNGPSKLSASFSSASSASVSSKKLSSSFPSTKSNAPPQRSLFGSANSRSLAEPLDGTQSSSDGKESEDEGKKTSETKENKPPKASESKTKSSGFSFGFGSLISKILPPSKNEIKLPDDRKQAIVWDDKKKRWVNTDEDEEETTKTPPPPTDLALVSKKSSAPSLQKTDASSVNSSKTTTEPPRPNKFSLQKGRGARSQYVDVMGKTTSTPSPVPQHLLDLIPRSSPALGIFTPNPPSEPEEGHSDELTDSANHSQASQPYATLDSSASIKNIQSNALTDSRNNQASQSNQFIQQKTLSSSLPAKSFYNPTQQDNIPRIDSLASLEVQNIMSQSHMQSNKFSQSQPQGSLISQPKNNNYTSIQSQQQQQQHMAADYTQSTRSGHDQNVPVVEKPDVAAGPPMMFNPANYKKAALLPSGKSNLSGLSRYPK